MIGLLLSTFTYSTKIKKQIEQTSVKVLQRKYTQERLTQIFSASSTDFKCSKDKLTFVFDQGPDLQKAFSGKVKASLFLDNHQLKLAIQSIEDENLARIDTLLEHISSLEWAFLPQPEAEGFGKETSKTSWDDKSPPLAIRLTLNLEDGLSVPFAFFTAKPIFEMSK